MKKNKRRRKSDTTSGSSTLQVAGVIGGLGGLSGGEVLYIALKGPGGYQVPGLPSWRAHSACICLGLVSFVVTFFCLVELETKSRILAWRSSAPWIPLILVTAFSTVIHIPALFLLPACAIYFIWAYRHVISVG